MATSNIAIKLTCRVRFKSLLLALNWTRVNLGFAPIVPSWFIVTKVEV
jgi:hypothetical protein